MKIILLNAPPRAGKDTAAAAIITGLQNIAAAGKEMRYIPAHHKMAESLKKGAHALFGVDMSAEWYEENKDKPLPEFMNKSPREVYINLSEDFVKPFYGKQAFGWMFVNRLRPAARLAETATGQEYLCICSDLGFEEELQPLIAAYDADNILIIHIVREGCDFGNDSRSYIKHPDIRLKTIINRGTVQQLQLTAIKAAHDWLMEKADQADANTCATA